MPEIVLTNYSHQIICPHGGPVTWTSLVPFSDVGEGGKELLSTDLYTIAGCPFVLPSGRPSPCVRVVWMTHSEMPDPASKDRRKVTTPAGYWIRPDSVGMCLSANGAPQGPAQVLMGQYRDTFTDKIKKFAQDVVDAAQAAQDQLMKDTLGGGF